MKRIALKKKASVALSLLVLVSVFIYSLGARVLAQTIVSDSTLVSATIPSAVSITVPPTLNLNVTVGSQTVTPLTPITVASNVDNWQVTVSKNQDLTSGANTIPSNRLMYTSTTTNGTGVGTQTEFQLPPGTGVVFAPTTATGGATISVNYFLTTLFTDPPGTYSATHTYTLTAP